MELILASKTDVAAMNIVSRLREFFRFEEVKPGVYSCGEVKLALVDGEVTELSSLPLPADEVIVVSRHASETGEPTLTAHVPGGLKSKRLAIASPETVATALRALLRERDRLGLKYKVSLEATHHGPFTLEVPVTFIEIGSSRSNWLDTEAAMAVARAAMEAASSRLGGRRAVGIGGPHYAPRHTRVALESDVRVGHIIPKYVKPSWELVKLAVERTRGGAEVLVLDWKGLSGEERRMVMRIADELGIRAVKSEEFLKSACKGLK